eukprot:gene1500-15938_t
MTYFYKSRDHSLKAKWNSFLEKVRSERVINTVAETQKRNIPWLKRRGAGEAGEEEAGEEEAGEEEAGEEESPSEPDLRPVVINPDDKIL